MPKFAIIDPSSAEVVRSNYAYYPHFLYSLWAEQGKVVTIRENWTTIDEVPTADYYYVAVWSTPQVETVRFLQTILPPERTLYFGYYPLISKLGLPTFKIERTDIKKAIIAYPKHFQELSKNVLCDRDMHLKKYTGYVVPAFSSFGCPRGCAFCPASANMDRHVVSLLLTEFELALRNYRKTSYQNIHMMDEDFFLSTNVAKVRLEIMEKFPFKYIVLGSTEKILKFLNRFGWDPLIKAKVVLLEVGLESASPEIADKMGKPPLKHAVELAEASIGKIDIFWLSLTFFPGETIETLRETGTFLRKYGKETWEVYPRIVTNGTYGGLGQFFQPYIGTPAFDEIEDDGIFLTNRPMRLIPSFIPYSFLHSKINIVDKITNTLKIWQDIYRVNHIETNLFQRFDGETIAEAWSWFRMNENSITDEQFFIYMALAARLGYI